MSFLNLTPHEFFASSANGRRLSARPSRHRRASIGLLTRSWEQNARIASTRKLVLQSKAELVLPCSELIGVDLAAQILEVPQWNLEPQSLSQS